MKLFEVPEIEIIKFHAENILLTASGLNPDENEPDPGENGMPIIP